MMKLKASKIVSILLIVTVFLSTSAFASNTNTNTNTNTDDVKLESITEQYNLKKVDSAPEGVVPIKVDSVEELESILKNNEKIVENSEVDSKEINSDIFNNGLIAPLSTTYKHVYLYDSVVDGGGHVAIKLRGDALVKHTTSAPYTKIESINAWTEMTGLTLGYVWKQNSCYGVIYNSNQSVYVQAAGVLESYLVVNGGILLWSHSVHLYDDFSF